MASHLEKQFPHRYQSFQEMSGQAQQETFQCSGCHKRFFANGFKVSRLGCRLKTCIECSVRAKAKREAQKCEHGRRKDLCKECGGQSLCAHGYRRSQCQICDPDSYRKMKTLRDFRGFQKLDSWPANLIEYSRRHAYDQ